MNKDNITHFVGFITRLEPPAFVDQWSHYATGSENGSNLFVLQETGAKAGKYKYVSRHEFGEQSFRFSFMKTRDSEHFPEQKARVIMFGGYIPEETAGRTTGKRRIRALFTSDRIELDAYRLLAPGALTIYQPFYENCLFSYILEFFVQDNKVDELVDELTKKNEAVDIAVYHECQIPNTVY